MLEIWEFGLEPVPFSKTDENNKMHEALFYADLMPFALLLPVYLLYFVPFFKHI
ncbi:MAG: hypothetical protein PHY09_00670 [Desulfuromonadaceae bacterium]|nr:hypothetical protein [Desulfuromonadaceae bacterium]MDD5106484.1 hypothetical protein [Desulfuromonadaceae bacterium]